MKLLTATLIVFLFAGTKTYSQANEMDSLLNALNECATTNDSIETILELTRVSHLEAKDSLCTVWSERGIQLCSSENHLLSTQLKYYKLKSEYFLGEDLNAIKDGVNELNQKLESITDTLFLAKFSDFRSTILITLGLYDEGALAGIKSLEYYNHLGGHDYSKVNICSNLSVCYQSLNEFDKSLFYTRQGLEYSKNLKPSDNLASIYYNSARTFVYLGLYEEGKQNFERALKIYTEIEKRWGVAISNCGLGNLYGHVEEYKDIKKAEELLRKSLKLFNEEDDQRHIAMVEILLCSVLRKQNKNTEALELSTRAISFSESVADKVALTGAYLEQAEIFKALNQPDSAIYYAKKTSNLSKELGNNNMELRASEYLAKNLKEYEKYEDALSYSMRTSELQKELNEDKLSEAIAFEKTRQNIELEQEKRKNAESLANFNKSRSQLYLFLALGLAVIIVIGGYLYRQLRKTRKLLELQNQELNKLNATREKFMGIIAHDLKSPLTALDSVGEQFTYYLSKNNTEKLKKLAQKVDDTSGRMTKLLDNLLNWALIQNGSVPYKPSFINVRSAVSEVNELYSDILETKGISLINSTEKSHEVWADNAAFQTILRNLISNAIKFSSAGDSIQLLSIKNDNDQIKVQIKDEGTGMNPGQVQKLFSLEKKSSKGTAGEKGTGLGLILCHDLVKQNHGEIHVSSAEGQGTEFTFILPETMNAR